MKENYEDGKLHGKTVSYYPDLGVVLEADFERGLLHGEVKVYLCDGNLERKLTYECGEKKEECIFERS